MEQLLSLLKTIPEYTSAVASLKNRESVAITGIGQINRSHMIAGLCRDLGRPMVLLCQDEIAARRMQEELKNFLGDTFPILPGRELTMYDAAVVSRSWEQKRLRQMYDLAMGNTPVQIMTWEAMSQRTMPRDVLLDATFTLEVGTEYHIDELIGRLTAAGYSRCGMVEGSGQFAVRGGIIDIFSPAADLPIRAEFFSDELDTMGYFDPATQRRSENIDSVTILPVGETQPGLHPKGSIGPGSMLTSSRLTDYMLLMEEIELQGFAGQVSELNLNDQDNLILITVDGYTVRLGDSSSLQAKIGTVRAVIDKLNEMVLNGELARKGGVIMAMTPGTAIYDPD